MPASGGLSLIELRRRVETQPVAQHIGGVLPQQRRRDPDRAGAAVDLPGRADLGDEACLRVLDLHRHVAIGRQRARKRFVDAKNRACRYSERLERLLPVPPRSRREARIACEANIPAVMSPMGTPTLVGGLSGVAFMLIIPEVPCAIWS